MLVRIPKGQILQRFSASRAYASLQARQAMNSTLASLTSAKPMILLSIDRPLAWELFSSLGFPPKMLQLIKDLMTTLCVQCKQTRADRAAGSRFTQALSKVM